ncbi:MAG TPA: hypothetical protein VMH02_09485 [Verrucomicrobiae bacterium]|nr:hypothetical protein [Verrucomicrobiae bacterium]
MNARTLTPTAAALGNLEEAFARGNPLRFEDALERLGRNEASGHLIVDDDCELGFENVTAAGGAALRLESPHVASLKRWIGVLDEELDRGIFAAATARPALSPEALERALETDAAGATAQLLAASEAYLFGYAREHAAYAPLLERHFAPYVAGAFVLDRLTIAAGGRLTIGTLPTLLLVRTLVLHDGGSIHASVVLRADVGTFEKRS